MTDLFFKKEFNLFEYVVSSGERERSDKKELPVKGAKKGIIG